MPGLKDGELARLKAASSAEEWNEVCNEIKKARGGVYPPDWWNRVMASGLFDRVQKTWGRGGGLKVRPIV